MNYLFQRARHHGVSALFTRREYASKPLPKVGLGPTSIQKQRGFEHILNRGATSLSEDLIVLDGRGVLIVSVSAEQAKERGLPLGEVHMRQDVNVVEDERWDPV